MKEYLYLFLHLNKNYFFERYKFFKKEKFETFYTKHYFIKSILIAMILMFLSYKFTEYRNVLLAGPFLIFLFKLLGLDSRKWSHYYRHDWLLSYPNDFRRFITLLTANIVIDFFILDNIIVYTLIQMTVYDLNSIFYVYTLIILVYILILSVQLVLMQSNVVIKKIYSVVVYLLSSSMTILISYFSIGTIVKFAQLISLKDNVINFILNEIKHLYLNMIALKNYIHYAVGITIFLSIINMFFLIVNFKCNNFQNGKQNIQAKTDDFLFIKLYKKLFKLMYPENKEYMQKELSLIVELYTFNYKEYLNTFFIDRSVFMLLGILYVLSQFNHFSIPYIVFLLVLMFFYIDVSSGVNVKLLSNMSFISDYNTIQICNSSNVSIQSIVKNKLQFFRIVRFPSLICYLIISSACCRYFGMTFILYVLLMLSIVVFWYILPKIFMANNLIYIRSNYDQFKKYIEDSAMFLHEIREFFLIEMYYRYMFFGVIMYATLAFLLNSSLIQYIFFGVLLSELLFIAIIYLIMCRIIKNICYSLEMGDYSVDVSRIFKK